MDGESLYACVEHKMYVYLILIVPRARNEARSGKMSVRKRENGAK